MLVRKSPTDCCTGTVCTQIFQSLACLHIKGAQLDDSLHRAGGGRMVLPNARARADFHAPPPTGWLRIEAVLR